jgi:phytanoyl-CoA hydroxylase
MNNESAKQVFDRDGFLVVQQFLTERELSELIAQLDRYIRAVVPELWDTHAFYHDRDRPETLKQMQFMDVDLFFHTYTQHPKWKALAETLMGEPTACQSPQWFNKPAGICHPTPPHQDNYYFNLQPPNMVTIWLALDPVDDENGCLRYLPGSHRRGFRPHSRTDVLGFSQGITDFGVEDEATEKKIHLAPGDAVAHHAMTVHRAEPNGSAARDRRAFAMVFRGKSCRGDEAGLDRYQEWVRRQHEQLELTT